MADNRKYYYLKLKESYFDEDAIVLLESMQDGMLYSNILLKLYLKSLKNGGKLQLDENIPYTAPMIAAQGGVATLTERSDATFSVKQFFLLTENETPQDARYSR